MGSGLCALVLDVPLTVNAALRSVPQGSPCGHSLLPCHLHYHRELLRSFVYLIMHPGPSPGLKVSSIRKAALVGNI